MPFDAPLPLFPLGLVLLPGEPVPLHIFEPRYRELVRVCLDADRPFGIVYASEDGLAAVGCTARIHKVVAKYDDGRLDILAVGEDRFHVGDLLREASYLQCRAEAVRDAAPTETASAAVRQKCIAQHMRLLEIAGEAPRPSLYDSAPEVSFIVGRNAGLELPAKQRLLALRTEAERLAFLTAHFDEILVRLEQARRLAKLAQGDGRAGAPPELGTKD